MVVWQLLHSHRWLFLANLRIRMLPWSSCITENRFDIAFNYQANHSWLVPLVLLCRCIHMLLIPIGHSILKKVLNWIWWNHTCTVNIPAQSRMAKKMNWWGTTSECEVRINVDSRNCCCCYQYWMNCCWRLQLVRRNRWWTPRRYQNS